MPEDPVLKLFEQICKRKMEQVQDWLKEPASESEILDFKKASNDSSPLSRDDKGNLSIALSGFTNSAGGLIVWGVDCRRDRDGVDAVTDLKPIKGLKKFLSALQTCYPQVTSPGISEVQIEGIEEFENSDTGFAIVYVPRGEGEPVMATAAGLYRFYFRVNDKFEIMPQYMLADRFGRRPHPKLEMVWQPRAGGSEETRKRVLLGVKNVGLGPAREMCVTILTNGGENSFSIAEGFVSTNHLQKDDGKVYAWDSCWVSSEVLPHQFIRPIAEFVFPFPTNGANYRVEFDLVCDGFTTSGWFELSEQTWTANFLKGWIPITKATASS